MSQQIKRAGKRGKRMKNHSTPVERDVRIKGDEQEYAVVERAVGGDRYYVLTSDNRRLLAHKRGALKYKAKKIVVCVGDTLLVSKREFSTDDPDVRLPKCDILHKYTDVEIAYLRKNRELLHTVKQIQEEDDSAFDFNLV